MIIVEDSARNFNLNDLEYSPGKQINLCAFEVTNKDSDEKLLVSSNLKNIAPIEGAGVKLTMHDNFKYHSVFDGIIVQAKIAEDQDKYLATASINQLKQFLPTHINLDVNKDLMAVAFDAFVVNRGNKNGHIIGNDVAFNMLKNFVNKPFNIEHNRKTIVGFCTGYGFSSFGSSQPLTSEQVQDTNEPFNVVLSGFVWKVANPEFAEELAESSDPSSPKYLSVSASWELGFNEFNVAKGSKNLNEATIVDEPDTIMAMKDDLKVFGGSGFHQDGQPIYLNLQGSVLPLGIGFTNNPAAEVKGVLVRDEAEDYKAKANLNDINNKKSVHSNIQDVKNNMQINKLEDITDEAIKELTASAVREFISSKIAEHAKDWSAKVNEKETSLEAAVAEATALKTDLESIKAEVAAMQQAIKANEIAANFQRRMSLIDEEFNLTDADREIIAEDLNAIENDEAFTKWYNRFAVLASGKKKSERESVDQQELVEGADKIKDGGSNRAEVSPAKNAPNKTAQKIKNDKDVSADDEAMADEENEFAGSKAKADKKDKEMDNGPVTATAGEGSVETNDEVSKHYNYSEQKYKKPAGFPESNVESLEKYESQEHNPLKTLPEVGENALASKVAKIVASVQVEEQLIPNSMSPAQDSLVQKISAAFNRNSVTFNK